MGHLPRADGPLTIDNFDDLLIMNAAECDLRRLRFIDAYALVGIACAVESAEASDRRILFPERQALASHLSGMGFSELAQRWQPDTGEAAVAPINAPDVLVPLQSARDNGGAQQLSDLLWAQLQAHTSPQTLNGIAEGVWEMVANALEHSGRDAFVMGQVYHRGWGNDVSSHDGTVQVVIGDVGCGILASLNSSDRYALTSHASALTKACEYLVSSVDDPGRGQGLSTTLEQLDELGGRVVLRSGAARLDHQHGSTTIRYVPPLPGVIVALSAPL